MKLIIGSLDVTVDISGEDVEIIRDQLVSGLSSKIVWEIRRALEVDQEYQEIRTRVYLETKRYLAELCKDKMELWSSGR